MVRGGCSMAKIIYRISPVSGFRSEWYTLAKGAANRVSVRWVKLLYDAKKLGVLVHEGICKDSSPYFSIKNTSGEERVYKFIK